VFHEDRKNPTVNNVNIHAHASKLIISSPAESIIHPYVPYLDDHLPLYILRGAGEICYEVHVSSSKGENVARGLTHFKGEVARYPVRDSPVCLADA